MLVQCSKGIEFPVTEIAFKTRAIPSRTCRDILCVGVGVGKQLICQQSIWIALIDSLEDCAVIDVFGSLA